MGLFEEVVVNAKSILGNASKKAGKLIDVSKLRIDLAETHGKISKKLEELGEIIYNNYKQGGNESNNTNILFNEIDELYFTFNKVKEQLSHIRNKVICKKCSFENEQNSVYCSKCGAELLEKEDLRQDE
ncbi:MAG: hypothetical protein LBJ95_04880 [Oscillospiraceae bacterium]|jgi:ribosomal protein L40E|nr:hypothetical protein [Oscillospiraceae bacterium]